MTAEALVAYGVAALAIGQLFLWAVGAGDLVARIICRLRGGCFDV